MSKEAIVDLLYDFGTRADISVEDLAEEICRVAIPVVRCKDCKYWKPTPASVLSLGDCGLKSHERISSWSNFCCWGERKDDAAE